jgi:ribosomal protein S27E
VSPSRFDFRAPTKTVPCVTCGQRLVAELDSPEPHRCALCVIQLAPSTSGKTAGLKARRPRAA